jgi:hypothetical protein
MIDELDNEEESELTIALQTLFKNDVKPPAHIAHALNEMFQLQALHDLICAKLTAMREETGEEIMKFFLEWKMQNS